MSSVLGFANGIVKFLLAVVLLVGLAVVFVPLILIVLAALLKGS